MYSIHVLYDVIISDNIVCVCGHICSKSLAMIPLMGCNGYSTHVLYDVIISDNIVCVCGHICSKSSAMMSLMGCSMSDISWSKPTTCECKDDKINQILNG